MLPRQAPGWEGPHEGPLGRPAQHGAGRTVDHVPQGLAGELAHGGGLPGAPGAGRGVLGGGGGVGVGEAGPPAASRLPAQAAIVERGTCPHLPSWP